LTADKQQIANSIARVLRGLLFEATTRLSAQPTRQGNISTSQTGQDLVPLAPEGLTADLL
jgi:hypothetical protein